MATYANAMLARGASGAPITLSTADIVNWELASEQHKIGDNGAAAYEILQGTDSYFKVVTTNSSESISFGNAVTNPSVSFLGTGAFSLATTSLSASALTSLSAGLAVTTLSTLALGGANIGTNKLAITGTANISGALTVGGDLTVNGTTTTVNSTTLEVDDNMITVNSGPAASKDAGVKVERYQAANDAGTGDVVTDAAALESTITDIGDQTGMTSTQVKLTGGSATDDYYNGMWLKVTSGSSNNQVRKVTDYVGATKVATVASAWTTQNPADNDNINIYSPWVGIIYDESADEFALAHLAGADGADADLDRVSLRTGGLTVDDALAVTGASTFTGATTHSAGLGSTSGTFSTTLGVTGLATLTGGFTAAAASTVSAGGLSVTGGLNNNSGGITNAGAISGATTIAMGGALSGATSVAMGGALSGATTGEFSSNVTVSGNLSLNGASKTHTITGASSSLRLNDDIPLYFGTDSDITLQFVSAVSAFTITSATTALSGRFVQMAVDGSATAVTGTSNQGLHELKVEAGTATGNHYASLVQVNNTSGVKLTTGVMYGVNVSVSPLSGADADNSDAGTYYGVNVENVTQGNAAAATFTAIQTGTGWDNGIIVGSGGITIQSGALNLSSGGITNAGALAGITTVAASGAVTLSANSATITHSGTTSLTIASTSGTVIVESVTFTGGAISSATSIDGSGDLTMGTITMTGFSVDSSGGVSATGVAVNGALTAATSGSFSAAVTVGTTLGVTGAATLSNVLDFAAIADPGAPTDGKGRLHVRTVSTKEELFYVSDAGEVQLTSDGGINLSELTGLTGTTSNSFTVNNDLTDANADLVLGRTTGGNATLRWNGTTGSFDKAMSFSSTLGVTGASTLSGAVAAQAGLTVTGGNFAASGGTVSLSATGTAALDATTAITIGGTNATSIALGHSGIITTVTGGLTQQTGNFAASGGTVSLSATGTAVLDASTSVTIGGTNATSVAIGKSGITTTVTGGLTQQTGNFAASGGTVSLSATGTAALDATTAITIGGTNATSVAIGKSGITTTVTGGLTQLTGAVSLTGNAASSLTTSSGALTLTGASDVAVTSSTGDIILDATNAIVTENDLVAAASITKGQILAVNSDGKLAAASAASATHVAGAAAVAQGTADAAVKLAGMPGSVIPVATDISGIAKGVVVYLSGITAGAVTSSVTSTSGHKVIRVGVVVTPGTTAGDGYILFQPQFMYEVA